ncbi:uncharacterized protein LOC132550501 [Ylistrum balloti]|uniref:uncharacterized protein LOC132550501 n=1 Tax=Ylistrum balloti TaxID=509963 RepID=UPI002905C5CD|nr:uncharacterized protein LOC132550501 [Ylistrum balloti]
MTSSKDIIKWSGLCFLGLSVAVALYKRESLLSRFNWIHESQEDELTNTDENSPTKSNSDTSTIHACDSTVNDTDSDSFFSVTSECDGVCCEAELTDTSSSDDFEDTYKKNIVIKSGIRDLEAEEQNHTHTNAVRELAQQLSSPIVTSMESQTTRRDINDNGYNDVTSTSRVLEDTSPSTSEPTSYNRIYDGYRSIVTPNSPSTLMFGTRDK